MTEQGPSHIVGIGGSAGGLLGYRALLDGLPADTGMAFVIISHMAPNAPSHLANILSNHTQMPIAVASTGMPIRGNRVYVIAPDSDLLVEGQSFKVMRPRTARSIQVDLFLASLAAAAGASAIGVILAGFGDDGAEGCKRIKAGGGTTFAQDASAEAAGMPRSAQATGCVDFVLPPRKIADALRKIARHQNVDG